MKEKAIILFLCSILILIDFFMSDKNFSLEPDVSDIRIPNEITKEYRYPFLSEFDSGINSYYDNLSLYSISACMIDAETKRPLYTKNAFEIRAMASTTKIMTCLLAIENCTPDEIVTVSEYAASMPDVQLNMNAGDCFYLKDLLYSLMLESHNDTAVAIAEHVSGSVEAFAEQMNKKALEIGCVNTTFITPNGLDKEVLTEEGAKKHSTTAYDLALILSECILNSDFVDICQKSSVTIQTTDGKKSYHLSNHNSLLKTMNGVIAGKTGFTNDAGYCYVGAVERDGSVYVTALLGCGWPNNKNYKWYDMNILMDYAEDNYKKIDYRTLNTIPESFELPILNGLSQDINIHSVQVVKQKNPSYPDYVTAGPTDELRVVYNTAGNIYAPIESGKQLGSICYYINDTIIGEDKLIAAQSVEELSYRKYLKIISDRFLLIE